MVWIGGLEVGGWWRSRYPQGFKSSSHQSKPPFGGVRCFETQQHTHRTPEKTNNHTRELSAAKAANLKARVASATAGARSSGCTRSSRPKSCAERVAPARLVSDARRSETLAEASEFDFSLGRFPVVAYGKTTSKESNMGIVNGPVQSARLGYAAKSGIAPADRGPLPSRSMRFALPLALKTGIDQSMFNPDSTICLGQRWTKRKG